MTAGGSSRFRNYGDVLQRHEREQRIKKLVKVFTMFAIILIVVMLLIIVIRTEKKIEKRKTTTSNVSIIPARTTGSRKS